MASVRVRLIATFFLIALSTATNVRAASWPFSKQQEPAQNAKAEFDDDVRVGSSLVTRAENILKDNRSAEAMQVAVSLYVEAGKLFEKAAKGYEALLSAGATKEDVENSSKAMRYCIRSIKDIQKHFGVV